MESDFFDLFGLRVTTMNVSDVVSSALQNNEGLVVNTINPHSYVESKTDKKFRLALETSDILIPDGSGIVMAAKFLYGIDVNKIAGYDLFEATLNSLAERPQGGRVFLCGSTQDVLDALSVKIKLRFPNLALFTYSPPFADEFSVAEVSSQVDLINEFNPDVVFVGLSAPKQEKLIGCLQGRINCRFVSGVGAVFDFYSGNIRRPSKIWISIHLEWLVRLLGEPRRLWRRSFISTPIFLFDVCRAWLRR